MNLNSIFGIPPKVLDRDVLFNPFEEYFYIPTVSIQIGYFCCADFEVVGYKFYNRIIFRVINPYKSHVLRIKFT